MKTSGAILFKEYRMGGSHWGGGVWARVKCGVWVLRWGLSRGMRVVGSSSIYYCNRYTVRIPTFTALFVRYMTQYAEKKGDMPTRRK